MFNRGRKSALYTIAFLISMFMNHLGVLQNSYSYSAFQGNKLCISNNVPGDSHAAGARFAQQGTAIQFMIEPHHSKDQSDTVCKAFILVVLY